MLSKVKAAGSLGSGGDSSIVWCGTSTTSPETSAGDAHDPRSVLHRREDIVEEVVGQLN